MGTRKQLSSQGNIPFDSSFVRPFLWAIVVALFTSIASGQSFDVKTFRPWEGYGIPNGLWLTGDFSGDGKTDVFHAVQGSDYAHMWRSNGNGSFAVSTFRPWAGYGIPNGLWLTGDFNSDQKLDVFHAVAGADHAHIWLSNGNGTFSVGTFRPWAGYGIPNGIWLTGDFNGDGSTDVFHGVQGTDYAHIWFSNNDGTFTVGTFRPWAGYGIPNGLWLTGDFNGDNLTDIVHAVQGADYVHIWLAQPNGTFDVRTFRPWNGYGIPNGVWLIGDFNGDRRSDIFHAVAASDYAHIWTSNGNGTFSVSTFSPWSGYGIPNGIWNAIDVDADGKTDIVHAVQSTDYVHVWRSTTPGLFQVSTFSPWSNYGIPNGLWLTGDFDGDQRGDLFHAVQGASYVHPWLSVMPKPNELALEGLEVTQAIQNMAHDVTLISGKQTTVRAYLGINSGTGRLVKGVLRITRLSDGAISTVNSTGPANIDPALNTTVRTKRESLNLSLNFPIPASFTGAVSQYRFSLQEVRDASSNALVACSNCLAGARTLNFSRSAPMRLRVLGIRYRLNATPGGATFAPSTRDFSLLQSWISRAYPIPNLIYSQGTVDATVFWPLNCGDVNAQLSTLRALDIGSGASNLTHYYGLVSNGAGFMRGCASGIPSSPDPSTVASGPAGPNWSGDTDGTFGDWYGGHELGHTFGRLHPGKCGESNDDNSFPYPNGQISDNTGSFVGFDHGNNVVVPGVPTVSLPGLTSFDVMTYCAQPQWLSAYTYEGIRARLNAENPSMSGAGMAARSGAAEGIRFSHNGAILDSKCLSCLLNVKPALPASPRILIGLTSAPEVKTYMDSIPPIPEPKVSTLVIPQAVNVGLVNPVTGATRAPYIDRLVTLTPNINLQVPDIVSQVEVVRGEFISVVASINVTKKLGKFSYLNRVQRAEVGPKKSSTDAIIRLLDENSKLLASYPVELRLDTDIPKGEDQTAVINAIVPFIDKVRSVELLLFETVVDRRIVSKNAPVIVNVRLSEEKGGVNLSWTGRDADGDKLTYIVQLSIDGKEWNTVAVGQPESRATLTDAELSGQKYSLVRVIANDGFNNSVPVSAKIKPR